MRKTKTIVSLLLLFVLILSIGVGIYLYWGVGVNTSSINVKAVKSNSSGLIVTGSIYDSNMAFSGFSYKIKDNSIYIKPRQTISSPFRKTNQLTININNNLRNVRYIYLQGAKKNDVKLLIKK